MTPEEEAQKARYFSTHTQQEIMPRIDLRKLKSMTESDWQAIVQRVPFMSNGKSFLDYRDGKNRGCTNWVFEINTFKTATESGHSMLRTLNFINL